MRAVLCILAVSVLSAAAMSEWAFGGPDHRLHYRFDAHGNSIMDFSWAGYHAGGVKLPSADMVQRLTPAGGDNTARIQAALDDATGAVVLAPGEYEIGGTLSITRSGVVLRGEKGAIIRLTGKPRCFLEIRGAGTWHEEGPPAPILDAYVPAGATTFRVRSAADFHPGDRVLVLRPVTTEWIRFMGMDTLAESGSMIRTDRVVDSVEGDRVTLDVPLSDALDSRFTAAALVHYSFPGRIKEAGVEGLRITAPSQNVSANGQQYTGLSMDAVEDGWARDLELQDTQNGVVIGLGAKRLTLANVYITHSAGHSVSGASADFALQGTQILLDRCRVTGGGTSPVVTLPDMTGPIVVLNFQTDHGGASPQQGWATGLLVDGGKFAGAIQSMPGVDFSSRISAGSGYQGEIGWSVAWNVTSPFLLVQQPPGAMNWCIGCIGTPVTIAGVPGGIFDSLGTMVEPSSLYLQQLRDRLGPDALRNIGYAGNILKLL